MSAERKDLLLRTEAAPQEPIILDVKTTLARLDRASIKLESADHPDAKRKNSTQSSDGEYQVEDIEDRIKDICAGFDTSYDSAAKENPRCSAYAPAFAKVEQTYRDLIGEAVNLFETSEWKDSETKRLVNKLLTLKEPKYAPAKRIVLVGDSGTGKSSFINSLLDEQQLASKGASGSACTSIPIEYQQDWPWQRKDFAAEIVFLNGQTRKLVLKGHLRDYYLYHNEPQEELDIETLEESEYRASTAFEAFRVLFSNIPEFGTDEEARVFLSAAKSVEDEVVLRTLCRWLAD
ncbi:hypothetical protein MMC14_005242 [Varicellaria rhodocarpa]|nr:hypothetical protein [Varicellaria rhodocarpa]